MAALASAAFIVAAPARFALFINGTGACVARESRPASFVFSEQYLGVYCASSKTRRCRKLGAIRERLGDRLPLSPAFTCLFFILAPGKKAASQVNWTRVKYASGNF